jgi:hypothetical protein
MKASYVETFGGIQCSDRDPYPHCIKCGRRVDSFRIETPAVKEGPRYQDKFVNTGEVIFTVECHGETWRASNWRGLID